jgi:hypothetical protein
MFKKIPHKRKIRTTVKQIGILTALFFGTLVVLLLVFLFLTARKHLASPLATMQAQIQTLTHQPNATQQIKDALNKNNIAVLSVVSAQGNATLITLSEHTEVIFSNRKDIAQQIASLQLIERQLTIEGKRFHRIDFRFDDPVVTF